MSPPAIRWDPGPKGTGSAGVFVFDRVIHADNMAGSNLLDRPGARQGRVSVVGLGAQTRAPANQDHDPPFAKDWSHNELWDG